MFFSKKVILTEEESLIESIIKSLLKNSKTLIEIEPETMSYLVSDIEKEYFIEVDSVGVKITNHSFLLDKRLESGKIDLFKSLIKAETTKRRNEKKAHIFQNGLDLLRTINENLNK